MKKNRYGNRYLALMFLSGALIVPNATCAPDSTHSNTLFWAGVGTAAVLGATAYRIYSHRRDALKHIEKVTDEYYKTQPLKEFTVTDYYTNDGAKEDIIRNYHNGTLPVDRVYHRKTQPGAPQRRLYQAELPVVNLKKAEEQESAIDKQIRHIGTYRDPYYDRLERDAQHGSDQHDVQNQQRVEEVDLPWYQQWARLFIDGVKWIATPVARYVLYPADDIVRNNEFVNGWKVKKEHLRCVLGILNQDAEDINKRCTVYGS